MNLTQPYWCRWVWNARDRGYACESVARARQFRPAKVLGAAELQSDADRQNHRGFLHFDRASGRNLSPTGPFRQCTRLASAPPAGRRPRRQPGRDLERRQLRIPLPALPEADVKAPAPRSSKRPCAANFPSISMPISLRNEDGPRVHPFACEKTCVDESGSLRSRWRLRARREPRVRGVRRSQSKIRGRTRLRSRWVVRINKVIHFLAAHC